MTEKSRTTTGTAGARKLDGIRKQAIETGRNRLLVTGVVLSMAFTAIGVRLVDLTVLKAGNEPALAHIEPARESSVGRADILDRNGMILATSLPTASLYANPAAVLDAEEAADKLAELLPELARDQVLAKLRGPGRFQWITRNLTPAQQYAVNRLGLPGLAFQRGERRVYPHGRLAAHVLGLTDVDGRGIAGLEKRFDRTLRAGQGTEVALDLRVQSILRDELAQAMDEFRAIGAAGMVLDARSGEVVAMVSLPDFDPNDPASAKGDVAFNRAAKGVYEMGSTFKLFTAAMALDSGTVTMDGGYDASQPIQVARFTIRDFHAKNRWLSVPEIIVYSSNIGAAKMAVDVGTRKQRDYLGRLGLLTPPAIELPEVGKPLTPKTWREINTMTIAYGHGVAVSPLQLATGVAALVNGGLYVPPTLLKRPRGTPADARRVLAEATSEKMRSLMRLVVRSGTGRKADAKGYAVGGKTGTADKLAVRGYRDNATISSFVGAFPMDAPRYVVLVLVDEPKGNESTSNYATGGWVAAPAVGRIVDRMAALVGMAPEWDADDRPRDTAVIEARATGPAAFLPVAAPPARAISPPPSMSPRAAGKAVDRGFLKRVHAVLAEERPAPGGTAPGRVEQAIATH